MLLATLTALLLWAGHALGGRAGLAFALVLAGVMNSGAYWSSDKPVLRMCRAQEVSPAESPQSVRRGAGAGDAGEPAPALAENEEGGSPPLAGLPGVMIAPFVATLIQMAISRARELLADEAAARVMGKPVALASALRRIESRSRRLLMHSGSPAAARLFIQNPFAGGALMLLFSAHPPTEARAERLQAMAVRGNAAPV